MSAGSGLFLLGVTVWLLMGVECTGRLGSNCLVELSATRVEDDALLRSLDTWTGFGILDVRTRVLLGGLVLFRGGFEEILDTPAFSWFLRLAFLLTVEYLTGLMAGAADPAVLRAG